MFLIKETYSEFTRPANGHRAVIFLDDLHKSSSTAVLREIMTFIQILNESRGGMVRVSRMKQGEGSQNPVFEIPVRNITLIVAINPPVDRDLIKKYIVIPRRTLRRRP